MKVYFDNAATTPVDPDVADVVCDVLKNNFGNPSSIHAWGREARVAVENARKKIADLFGVPASTILFTSCATESINITITSAIESGVEQIITSKLEHHAILHTASYFEELKKCKVEFLSFDEKGNLSLRDLELLLQNKKQTLVALMHANNEIGNLLPMQEVAALCKKNNALFLCDTVQSVGKNSVKFNLPGLSYATGSAHKFHGPKGIGFLYHAAGVPCITNIHGGGQERGLRSGTENVSGMVGMAKALEKISDNQNEFHNQISELKEYFASKIESEIPNIKFNGTCREGGLVNILNVTFPDNEKSSALIQLMDVEGIAVSGGSACNSGISKGSHVLQALNVDPGKASVRFSFSRFNTKEEADYCISVLKKWF
ncbi:MAG: cysteine desulfurase family protein [Bacteroidota bacterium]